MKQGIYWKRKSNPDVFWCESKDKIREEVKFNSVREYKDHRKSKGYDESWDEIQIKREEEIEKVEIPKQEKKQKRNGLYWKRPNDSKVFWCQSYENITEEKSFNSVGEYREHRKSNGYDESWNHIYVKLDDIKYKKLEIENNKTNNKEKEFERIYIVHLNRLTERKKNILKHLKHLYNVVIIDAIDKNNFAIEDLEEGEIFYTKDNLYCKDKKYCWCNGGGHNDMRVSGRIACAWSHSKIYDDMITNNIKNALVFEDDFDLVRNIDYLRFIEKRLPEDYDYIYFSHSRLINYGHEYEPYDEYFVKLKQGWKETINYALTLETAKKLKEYLLPIRGAADGYIAQHIDYLKTIKNVYLSRMDLATNLSGYSGAAIMDTTIDVKDKKLENEEKEKLNVELSKYSIEYDENKRKNRMLMVTGYWKVNNKYKTDEKYKDWMKNTLLINSDLCVFYEEEEVFNMINEIRKYSNYKTYYIRRPLDKFFVSKYELDKMTPHHYFVPSIDLGKIYLEKMSMIKLTSKLYESYEWYTWMDIGVPVYRGGMQDKVYVNYDCLDKARLNCNHTHFGYMKEIIEEFKKDEYKRYYHNISGSAFIFHHSIIDKYNKIFYNQLDIVVKLKNEIDPALIIDDQCVWTEIYAKNEDLFKIIPGKYGDILKNISLDAVEYNIKGTGQLGNQLMHLIYELYINKDSKRDVIVNFKNKIFKSDKFKVELYGDRNDYAKTYIFKDNKVLDGKKVKEFVKEKLLKYVNYPINGIYWKRKGIEKINWSKSLLDIDNRIEFENEVELMKHRKKTGYPNDMSYVYNMDENSEIELENMKYDTLIHIRTLYSNPDENYYLQPNMVFYDYIFKNLDLGSKVGIVYGYPKNPIVDELVNKYKIKYVMSSTNVNDILTLTNCKNLVWSTSTMCWAGYLLSSTIERNIVFNDIKKYFRTGVFFDDESYLYVKTKKEIKKSNLNELLEGDLYI